MDNFINKIINGDCIEILRSIPDNSIDMTFADPPFNLRKKYNNYKDSLEFQKYLEWSDTWIYELVRVTKPSGSIFVHNIPKWLTFFAASLNKYAFFKHWIAWDAPTAPMGKSLQPSHYGILFYSKSPLSNKVYELRKPHERDRKSNYLLKDYGGKKAGLHPFGPLISDVWTDIHRIKHRKYRDDHPCQLPIPLLERLILMTTDAKEIVLDPFMGTGTTAVAAKKLGRNFVGIEIDPLYVEISEKNVSNVQSDSRIGNAWVSFYLNEVRTLRNIDWNYLSNYFELPTNNKDIDFFKIKLIKTDINCDKFLKN